MPKFMLTVFENPDAAPPSPEAIEQMMSQTAAHQAELKQAGVWVFFGTLTSPDSATVVRAPNGDMAMTDGPYAEAKEQIGGFTVIDVADLDEALEWARKGSEACMGWAVEVRPFAEHPG